ncbi:MAG TPA: non-homologous end-joining DNA ligase [Candidatus Thermoplasmatota archaeon]|nr:non-homologous end-joining DNA ligase [Candidatus Thermoplasmatota archaeon]
MPRRAVETAAPAHAISAGGQLPPFAREKLAPPGAPPKAFRIRHRPTPPFEWELHLQGNGGGDLVLSLPRGLPWAQDETRLTEPAPADAPRAPTWDEGRYHTERAEGDEVTLRFEGTRVRGRYALRKEGARVTLRRVDPASVRPFPDRILPMLAHASGYPANEEEYAFELKWDGVRAIAYVENGRLTLRSRNLNNITAQYPELRGLADALPGRQLVLDGEIIAPDETGRPSFQRLQNRLGVVQRGLAAKRSEETPVIYVIFDILYLDGHDVMPLPYEERRELLESLPLTGPSWRVAPVVFGEGKHLLEMPGWEGVVAKRLGSAYEPGARSRAWIKIKRQKRQELVIAGWTEGKGARGGRIGALVLGYYDLTPEEAREKGTRPRLLYAGSAGTGFSAATLDGLKRLLEPDIRDASPFDVPIDKKGVTFVEPRYVAEFEFTEWTSDGKLRHPSYKGLREDKSPHHVVREET